MDDSLKIYFSFMSEFKKHIVFPQKIEGLCYVHSVILILHAIVITENTINLSSWIQHIYMEPGYVVLFQSHKVEME